MVTVIVCTYNRSASLARTLRSLADMHVPEAVLWEVIVVDNNSTDDTPEVVRTFAATENLNIGYVRENVQGVSHARNAGLRAAQGDIVAFTDDDVTIDPQWLAAIQHTFQRFDCAAVGGRIIPLWSTPKPAWLRALRSEPLRQGVIVSFEQGQEPCELTVPLVGANMAFRKDLFEEYGIFRTDLGKCGADVISGEDTEFCLRLLRARQKIMYAPDAIIYHPVPKTNLKKQFRDHYFACGRYGMRTEAIPPEAVLWFGVPRYMFRSLLSDLWNWLSCFGSNRFRRWLQVWESLGAFQEAYRISKATSRPEGSRSTVGASD